MVSISDSKGVSFALVTSQHINTMVYDSDSKGTSLYSIHFL